VAALRAVEVVKVDGVTIAKLLPLTTGITGRVEAEISRLDDFVNTRGRSLQVVTDNDVYEADARFMRQIYAGRGSRPSGM
jgi:hypothetical protein